MKTKAKGIQKIEEYLKAYVLMTAQLEAVKSQQEKMKEYLVRYMEAKRLNTIEIDGMKVDKVDVGGFKFDEDTLYHNISVTLFNAITKRKVDIEKFKSAILLNKINPFELSGRGVEITKYCKLLIKQGKPVIKKVLI